MIRVLIVNDDKNLRKVLMTELPDEALYMEEAETGMKAISLLEVNEYDVLLLDLNLPGLKGGLKRICQKRFGQIAPWIRLSALS